MKINKLYKVFALGLLVGFSSCEAYLDKSVEANVTEDDIFKKFITFNGFVEDMYQCVVDVANRDIHGINYWNWGDDFLQGSRGERMGDFESKGDYIFALYALDYSVFMGDWGITDFGGWNSHPRRGYWSHGWMGIRKANIALSKLDQMVEPYQLNQPISLEEQRDLLKGQSLFFRGYFHFEILRAWGGIPYIDYVIDPAAAMNAPRLSYWETAERIDQDLTAAIPFLPIDWDLIPTGQITEGENTGRITKGAAYACQGKNLLYAGSPLMNGTMTGTYEYNKDYCKRAAVAFAKVIELADQGVYELIPYSEVSNNFYKEDATQPWTKETVFSNTVSQNCCWNHSGDLWPSHGGFDHYVSPTENYVENYGMVNGLPITDDQSGFNPNDPFKGRDPRFYRDLFIDGDTIAYSQEAVDKQDNIAQLYIGGKHRILNGSQSGYGWHKFRPIRRNGYDDGMQQSFYMTCPKIRLADVYLMYAEAVNEAYGPNVVPSDIPNGITAIEAVNRVRNRSNVPDLSSKYTSDALTMRESIRNERAVELAFENHRWYDLRRWYIAHLPKYKEKYILDYDKDHTYFSKRLFLTKIFEMKHYWMPFPTAQVNLYPGFYQNPGW